jgi:hypothetical protein
MLKADGKIDLFEYCLQVVLFSYLDVFFKRKKPATVQYRAITAVAKPAALVLSILARVGHATETEAEQSFGASLQPLKLSPPLAAKSECTLAAFGAALDQLAQASPPVKRAVVAAVTTCIAADGTVTLEESELLRAICAALGCPVPPLADAAAT